MRISNVIENCFTEYKIEKWNEEKNIWEYKKGYINIKTALINYKYLLKNNNGIYRLIKVIEIDEK